MMLLHSHSQTGAISGHIFEGLLHEVFLDGLIHTLKIIPFLFLAYLFMEFIEHKASEKLISFMKGSGKLGPAIGGAFGVLPHCAFSAAASNLYTGRVITLGTLVAVFLATSDEMLPIMLSEGIALPTVFAILGYKLVAAVIAGFATDLILRLLRKDEKDINIDEICENDNCHCERGILHSAIHHTLTISLFIFIVTILINALVFFIGSETLGSVMSAVPFVSHITASLIGLIPGCAASVALTKLGLSGIVSVGAMMSGLFSAAGVGLIVLFRVNKHRKENFVILAILIASGIIFGLIADLIGFSSIIA